MEHLTKIVGEYLTEPNSKVKAEDLVWTERDISISQKIMTGLSGHFFMYYQNQSVFPLVAG